MNSLIPRLQAKIQEQAEIIARLKAEKAALLNNRVQAVEKQVQERTVQLQVEAERDRLLAKIARRMRHVPNLEDVFGTSLQEVQEYLKTDRVLIYRFQSDRSAVVLVESLQGNCSSVLGQRFQERSFSQIFTSWDSMGGVEILNDLDAGKIHPDYLNFLTQQEIRSAVFVPIEKSNQLWGVLSVQHCHIAREWKPSEVDLLKQFAVQIAMTIQQTTLFEQAQRELSERKRSEETLRNISLGVSAATGEAFFHLLVEHLAKALNVESAFVGELILSDLTPLHIKTVAVYSHGQTLNNFSYDLADTPCYRVINQQFCLYPEQVQAAFPTATYLQDLRAQSYLATPLIDSFGRVLGVMAVLSSRPQYETKLMEEILQIFAVRATAELERQQAEEALRQLNAQLECRVQERTAQLKDTNQHLRHEIIERKQIEVELRESQAQLQDLLDNAHDLIHSVSLKDGRFLYVNRAWRETLGYSESELTQLSIFDLLHPNSLPDYYKHFQALQTATKSGMERVEATLLTKGGKAVVVEGNINCRFEKGIATATRGIFRDITERKQTEEALQESEQRFRQMAETIREVFWMSDPNHERMIYVSPAYEQLWGCSCQSLYDNPRSFVDMIHPEDCDRVLKAFPKQVEGKYDEEYRLILPTGEQRWIRDRAFPILNAEAEVYRIVGIAEDITQYKWAEAEVRKALQQEKELNELKSRFISMTSHEFRTPLTAILGSTELLKYYSDRWTHEKRLTFLERIYDNVQHMTQMLDDVLLLGQAEAGKLTLQPFPINVENFCQNFIDELAQGIGSQHQLIFSDRSQCQEFTIDEKMLRHILSNLFSNAIKYSPVNSVIELTLNCQSHSLCLQVRDEGMGIPPQDQPRLFDSFYRASNVSNIRGTGLGLSIVKMYVSLLNGTISVNSQVNQGTTFTVMIPDWQA
ncbi:MAG: PAS domain S-box protein [Chroococcales cyanobacterium]